MCFVLAQIYDRRSWIMFEMTFEKDISGLLHKCSLNGEGDDEMEITDEQKGGHVEQCKMSILGHLASFQSFNREGLKDSMLRD
ncbi:hypothetical protein Syun_029646 [Stephania yunnanensis]|uniref:Uncharacterized protein n=1 Tax=Stephania yunnanensis TaxID=152371 RepID=A0AAP0HJP9_9MAGN